MTAVKEAPARGGFGWRPQLPDQRDLAFVPRAVSLPPRLDLASLLPAAWNQGNLGSCTSFGIAASIAAARAKEGKAYFEPAHLHLYWHEREREGTIDSDAGAMIRDGIKVAAQVGVAPEKLWSYTDTGEKWKKKPSAAVEKEAVKHKATKYTGVNQHHVREALSTFELPVVFGFSVYQSFESQEVAASGVMPMPARSEQLLGGHCVAAVGYDDSRSAFKCRNSWAPAWGDDGHFWMPYAYMIRPDLVSDLWVVQIEA